MTKNEDNSVLEEKQQKIGGLIAIGFILLILLVIILINILIMKDLQNLMMNEILFIERMCT